MKTLGLLGGMSWESTASYYRLLNQQVRERLGALHSASLLLWSFDFQQVACYQADGRWDEATQLLVKAGKRLAAAGAEHLLICSNTMHRAADEIEPAVGLPLLHIADATAQVVQARGLECVALLGTRYTMEQHFYRGRLEQRHGLRVLVPGSDERQLVHDVIYEELCQGTVSERSRAEYGRIIDSLATRGARGVILGCTEIGLLVREQDTALPLFDSTACHVHAAVDLALRV